MAASTLIFIPAIAVLPPLVSHPVGTAARLAAAEHNPLNVTTTGTGAPECHNHGLAGLRTAGQNTAGHHGAWSHPSAAVSRASAPGRSSAA